MTGQDRSISRKFLPLAVAREKVVTEAEDTTAADIAYLPSVMPSACHLPLAGEEFT